MNTVLLGPPGAGKGTLAAVLKEKFGLLHISTGDLLREEMKSGSELGNKVKKYVEDGDLVPDEIVIQMIEKKLSQGDSNSKGYMLDGFPRTTVQAEDLDKILAKIHKSVECVLYMQASLPVVLQRLTGRRVCKKCGAIFHMSNRPPRRPGICDSCNGELYQRADDTQETICNRMQVYEQKTAPIIEYYTKQGKLQTVSGDRDTEYITEIVAKILRGFHDSQQSNKNQSTT